MNHLVSSALAEMDKIAVSRLEHPGEGGLDPASCRFLAAFIRAAGSARVLEFGSGFSSLMIAREIAAAEDNLLFSVDASPAYSASAREGIETSEVKLNAEFRVAALVPRFYGPRLLSAYNLPQGLIQARGPFDLALIDAPPYNPAVREAAFREAFPAVAPGGFIIFGEANLPGGEKHWAWERATATR
jgi:predicted O-methyltransferase YrrM